MPAAGTEHVVQVDDGGEFAIRHPLRERLEGELMRCPLHLYLAGWCGELMQPGRYRVSGSGDQWAWQALHA
jgi:Family of unknown function (DUF6085)